MLVPIFLLFLVVPSLVILIVYLYKLFYRSRANRALNGETGRIHFIEPFNFIVVLFLIVITTFSIITLTKLNKTTEELNWLRSLYNSVSYDLNDLQYELDKLNQKLEKQEEENRWIISANYDYDFKEVNDQLKVPVTLSINLKYIDDNSQLSLLVNDLENPSESQKMVLENNDFLSYEKTIELSLNTNYTIELLSEIGTLNQKEALYQFNFKDQFKSRVWFKAESQYENGKPTQLILTIENRYEQIDVFKLTKISYKLYDGNRVIVEKDITNDVVAVETGISVSTQALKYIENLNVNYETDLSIELIVEDGVGNVESVDRHYLVYAR